MRRRGRSPQPAKQFRNDNVLVRFRQTAQRYAWFTAFKEHGTEIIVGVQQLYCRISAPEPQAVDLLLAFHMRHAELQDCGCSVRHHCRRYPGTAHIATAEWRLQRERPTRLQLLNRILQASEPRGALSALGTSRREPRRNRKCHRFIFECALSLTRLAEQSSDRSRWLSSPEPDRAESPR